MILGMARSNPHRSDERGDLTTWHVRRARTGDAESLAWIAGRFGPLLLAQARYRLGPRLVARVDPEDLVQEVWSVAFPRLASLGTRDGHSTPVLLRFLSTTLLQKVNNLVRSAVTAAETKRGTTTHVPAHPDTTRGPLTRVLASEAARIASAALDELGERDRELVILRGVEQHTTEEVAAMLGISPNAASQAYRRALERLRARLPGSVFGELD